MLRTANYGTNVDLLDDQSKMSRRSRGSLEAGLVNLGIRPSECAKRDNVVVWGLGLMQEIPFSFPVS